MNLRGLALLLAFFMLSPNLAHASQFVGMDANSNLVDDYFEEKIRNSDVMEEERLIIIFSQPYSGKDIEALRDLGITIDKEYTKAINGISVDVAPAMAFEIPQLIGDVALVYKPRPVKLHLDTSTQIIRARSHVWNSSTLGFRGDWNSSIAVIDTGIDDTHPDLANYGHLNFSNSSVKIIGWMDFSGDAAASPEDYIGHGTHVASILAGTGKVYGNGTVNRINYSVIGTFTQGPGFVSYEERVLIPSTGTLYLNMSFSGAGEAFMRPYNQTPPSWLSPLAGKVTGSSSPFRASYPISKSGTYSIAAARNTNDTGALNLSDETFSITSMHPYSGVGDGNSLFAGVAPKAKLVGLKAFNRSEEGTTQTIIDSIEWAISNKTTYHIKVASMSAGLTGGAMDAVLRNAANNLVAAGVVFVVSGGNSFPDYNISDPALAGKVVTVASLNKNNSISHFSSNGNVSSTPIKPDIAAPGGSFQVSTGILAADSNDNDTGNYVSMADINPDDYTFKSGTSMAAPMVAGAAALVIQAMEQNVSRWGYTEAEALKVKMLLLMTASETNSEGENYNSSLKNTPPLNRGPKDNVEGYGKLNVDAAVEAAIMEHQLDDVVEIYLGEGNYERKVWARQVNLTGASTQFSVTVPPLADYDAYLYNYTPDQYGEPVLLENSTMAGNANESLVTTENGMHYIVVKWVSGSGNFSIRAIEPNPFSDIGLNISAPTNGSDQNTSFYLVGRTNVTANCSYEVWFDNDWTNVTKSGWMPGNATLLHSQGINISEHAEDYNHTLFVKCYNSANATLHGNTSVYFSSTYVPPPDPLNVTILFPGYADTLNGGFYINISTNHTALNCSFELWHGHDPSNVSYSGHMSTSDIGMYYNYSAFVPEWSVPNGNYTIFAECFNVSENVYGNGTIKANASFVEHEINVTVFYPAYAQKIFGDFYVNASSNLSMAECSYELWYMHDPTNVSDSGTMLRYDYGASANFSAWINTSAFAQGNYTASVECANASTHHSGNATSKLNLSLPFGIAAGGNITITAIVSPQQSGDYVSGATIFANVTTNDTANCSYEFWMNEDPANASNSGWLSGNATTEHVASIAAGHGNIEPGYFYSFAVTCYHSDNDSYYAFDYVDNLSVDYNCGDTVDHSWTLMHNLSCPISVSGILNIKNDDVALDCGGHTIYGASLPGNKGPGINITGNVSDIVIQNCILYNLSAAINVHHWVGTGLLQNLTIRNNLIYDNYYEGRFGAAEHGGISLMNFRTNKALRFDNITIYNNTIYGNNGGIILKNASNVLIENNNIYGNHFNLSANPSYKYDFVDMGSNTDVTLSGNYWGRNSCPTVLYMNTSNSTDFVDMGAYNESNGWLTGEPRLNCSQGPIINSVQFYTKRNATAANDTRAGNDRNAYYFYEGDRIVMYANLTASYYRIVTAYANFYEVNGSVSNHQFTSADPGIEGTYFLNESIMGIGLGPNNLTRTLTLSFADEKGGNATYFTVIANANPTDNTSHLYDPTFGGSTTNWTAISDFSNVTGLAFERPNYSKALFWRLNLLDNDTINGLSQFTSAINMGNASVTLGASVLPAFNRSATLYFYHLDNATLNAMNVMQKVKMDDRPCSACVLHAWNQTSGELAFNVTHWTTYSLDTRQPNITGTYPVGTVGAYAVAIRAATDENATCRYDFTDKEYANMTENLSAADLGRNHTDSITAVSGLNIFYVRCRDAVGNVNNASSAIAFTVSVTPPPGGGGGGGGGAAAPPSGSPDYGGMEDLGELDSSIAGDEYVYSVVSINYSAGGTTNGTQNYTMEVIEKKKTRRKNLQVRESDVILFTYRERAHSITVNSVGNSSVNMTLRSDPVGLLMSAGEMKLINLDADNSYDLRLTVGAISGETADLLIEAISVEIEAPEVADPPEEPETPHPEEETEGPSEAYVPVEKEIAASQSDSNTVIIVIAIASLLALLALAKRMGFMHVPDMPKVKSISKFRREAEDRKKEAEFDKQYDAEIVETIHKVRQIRLSGHKSDSEIMNALKEAGFNDGEISKIMGGSKV